MLYVFLIVLVIIFLAMGLVELTGEVLQNFYRKMPNFVKIIIKILVSLIVIAIFMRIFWGIIRTF